MIVKSVALVASAFCCISAAPMNGTINSGMPPERFRGNSAAIVIFTDRAGITALCGPAPPGYVIMGCRREATNGAPVLVMPNPCILGESEFYAKLTCHELGHRNGWSGEHEL